MYYRYDEVSVIAQSHLSDLKYDQECCRMAREQRRSRSLIRKAARNSMFTSLFHPHSKIVKSN